MCQIRFSEVGPTEVPEFSISLAQPGIVQIGSNETCSSKYRSTKVCANEIRIFKVGLFKIWLGIWILRSRLVPGIVPISEHRDLCFICHFITFLNGTRVAYYCWTIDSTKILF